MAQGEPDAVLTVLQQFKSQMCLTGRVGAGNTPSIFLLLLAVPQPGMTQLFSKVAAEAWSTVI